MRYENIMNDAYCSFLERKSSCKEYQMLKDKKSGQYYFKNESNPNQIIIGYIKHKKEKTFICIGVIDTNGPLKSEVFFCRIFSSSFATGEKKCYLEQGFVESKEAKMGVSENMEFHEISEDIFGELKKQKEILCSFCDILNLPSGLKIIEKHMLRRTVAVGKKPLESHAEDYEVSQHCQLTPLTDKEKLVTEMIYRQTMAIKKELEEEQKTSKIGSKSYVLQ